MAQVITLNKPIGLTPLQALKKLQTSQAALSSAKLTYVGRLDPMAEGLLLVLVNNKDEKIKKKLLDLNKTYQFQLLFGLSTDTYDSLGLITHTSAHQPSRSNLEAILPQFIGNHSQPYPPYSSKTVQGKPLFYYARTNQLDKITLPTKDIHINSLQLNSTQLISPSKLQDRIIQSIKLVKGDFRQSAITKSWQQYFTKNPQNNFTIHNLTTHCSSGTYVRSLAHRLGLTLNTHAITLSIKRISIGPYLLKNAIRLT